MLGGQVGADERLDALSIRRLGVNALALCAQLVGEHVGNQILLRSEVGVEGAVGQTGVGHEGRHAGAVDAVVLEPPPGRFEDPLSGGLLLALLVSHDKPPGLTGLDLRVCIILIL